MKSSKAFGFYPALFWAILGLVTAGVALNADSAFAADKGPKVGQKVGKFLQEAQKLAESKKFSEALAKVNEAAALPDKTPFEQFTVNDFQAYININLKNYGEVIRAYQATLDSEFLPAEEKPRRMKIITQLSYQLKDYAKAVDYGRRYLKMAGADSDMSLLIGQSLYLMKDFKGASAEVQKVVDQSKKSGQTPKEEWLQLIMSCEYEQKNMEGLAKVLEDMLLYYPSPEYWRDRIQLLQDAVAQEDRLMLETYRLALATNTLQPEEYVEMAEFALTYGLPGDARTILEKGFADQKLAESDKDRNTRMLGVAKTQAAEDVKILPTLEAEAAKAADGVQFFKLGEAYMSHGMFDKAIPALDAGMAKGGLKSPDEANLRLGIAKIGAGNKEDAKKAFAAVAQGTPLGQLARLWTIFADKGPGTERTEVATE